MKNNIRYKWMIGLMGVLLTLPMGEPAAKDPETVRHESGFYYTVKQGDTLWDLAERFYGSSDYWPNLWHNNPQIPNPHEIYPGEKLRLLHDRAVTTAAPPAGALEKSEIPAAAAEPEPEAPYYYCSRIQAVGFIRPKPLDPAGTLFKVADSKTLIGQGDLIFIKPTDGHSFALGSRYTLFRTSDPIYRSRTRELIGYQHLLTGKIEIIDILPEYAVGRVVKSYRGIKIGDFLTPFQSRSPKITLTRSERQITGRVIAAEERQFIIGEGHIAFIDKGADDGVTPGQAFLIYKTETHKFDRPAKKTLDMAPMYLGELMVLHTEASVSTVVVTKTAKSIHDGDKVLTPIPEIVRN